MVPMLHDLYHSRPYDSADIRSLHIRWTHTDIADIIHDPTTHIDADTLTQTH